MRVALEYPAGLVRTICGVGVGVPVRVGAGVCVAAAVRVPVSVGKGVPVCGVSRRIRDLGRVWHETMASKVSESAIFVLFIGLFFLLLPSDQRLSHPCPFESNLDSMH